MIRPLRAFSVSLVLLLGAGSVATAGERLVDGILGGAAGGLVLGPVGLVGGAVIGATAGPGIARSWGLKGRRTVYRRRAPHYSQR